jgi:excisionase family DNA binding protein
VAGGVKDIFSTHDVARICRVTPMTVIRWIEEGKLPAFKTAGGHRRVQRADLVGFCRERGIPFEADGDGRGRVLVVSGDPETRDRVAAAARQVDDGIMIEVAGDAFEAGRLAARLEPALVVLDQRTPGLDALEVCDRLSRGGVSLPPRAIVVLVPAWSPDGDRAYRHRGARCCLELPPADADIAAVVRETFEGGHVATAGGAGALGGRALRRRDP